MWTYSLDGEQSKFTWPTFSEALADLKQYVRVIGFHTPHERVEELAGHDWHKDISYRVYRTGDTT